ncbi:MAG TPA: SRPBCC family protein, partial [Anaerolineales bacterium]
DEVDRVISSVESVRGVKEVENHLQSYESAQDIPGLQGQPRRREPRVDALQVNWSPTTRLVASVGGLAMTVTGLGKRGLAGTAMGLSGLGLAARGITNKPIGKVVGIGGGRNAVNIHKTINIEAPVEEVYRFWEDIENFPRFMEHVKEVSASNGHSHWTITGPAGAPIEFDAITTKKVENQEIAWKSQPNEPIKSAGIVQFEPTPTGGTRVTVRMSYNPVAGELGHAVATLFGTNPKQAMDDDLVRMKSLIEEGKATAKGEEVTREEIGG